MFVKIDFEIIDIVSLRFPMFFHSKSNKYVSNLIEYILKNLRYVHK